MEENIREKIEMIVERGLSKFVVEQMLIELYETEVIRFDKVGNPYWFNSGEPLDLDVELVFD